jgi:hypothetical protein
LNNKTRTEQQEASSRLRYLLVMLGAASLELRAAPDTEVRLAVLVKRKDKSGHLCADFEYAPFVADVETLLCPLTDDEPEDQTQKAESVSDLEFKLAWAAERRRYGPEPLSNVKLGWELHKRWNEAVSPGRRVVMDVLIGRVIEEIEKQLNVSDVVATQIYERHLDYVAEAIMDDSEPRYIAQGVIERDQESPSNQSC